MQQMASHSMHSKYVFYLQLFYRWSFQLYLKDIYQSRGDSDSIFFVHKFNKKGRRQWNRNRNDGLGVHRPSLPVTKPSMLFSPSVDVWGLNTEVQTQNLASCTGEFSDYFGIQGHLFLITVITVNHPFHALLSICCHSPKSISWLPKQLNDQLPWEKCCSSRYQGRVWRK